MCKNNKIKLSKNKDDENDAFLTEEILLLEIDGLINFLQRCQCKIDEN